MATAWIVGVRLALLAMIVNVAAFLLPDHGRLALAAQGLPAEGAVTDTEIPAEALRRAGLTVEQAQGLDIPCLVSSAPQGALALDGTVPVPQPMTDAGHACDICITVSANALTVSATAAAAQVNFVTLPRRLLSIPALVSFSGHVPSSRDPPRGLG